MSSPAQSNSPPPPPPAATPLVRWGCVGLGGYAGSMSDLMMIAHDQGRLAYISACDPDLANNAARVSALEGKHVQVNSSLEPVLNSGAEAIYLPLPIDLHLPFTRKALPHAKAILCEKPAAGAVQDVDAMIAARDKAGKPVAVGFQHIYDPGVADLKRRMLDGVLGPITQASVIGCWPRDSVYYARNTWAGRWRRGDTWVLDSPANNALAHYMHLALFLLGPTAETSATPIRVEAQQFRANPIETSDTVALRVTLEGGTKLTVVFTHACRTSVDPKLVFKGAKGTLTLVPERSAVCPEVGLEVAMADARRSRLAMFDTVSALVRGLTPATPVGTLECARAHSVVVSAGFEATRIVDIPESYIQKGPPLKGAGSSASHGQTEGGLRFVPDIEHLLEACAQKHLLPAELPDFAWAHTPIGTLDIPSKYIFNGPPR